MAFVNNAGMLHLTGCLLRRRRRSMWVDSMEFASIVHCALCRIVLYDEDVVMSWRHRPQLQLWRYALARASLVPNFWIIRLCTEILVLICMLGGSVAVRYRSPEQRIQSCNHHAWPFHLTCARIPATGCNIRIITMTFDPRVL